MNIANCERMINEINGVISYITSNKDELFFQRTNVITPNFSNQELSFLRLVSWLYTIYFETGKMGLDIIQCSMNDEAKKEFGKHKKLVQNFRTKLQHNLDISKGSREYSMQNNCFDWSLNACGVTNPNTEEQWKKCSEKLISECEESLMAIKSTLESMTGSQVLKEMFKSNWDISKTRNLPAHMYDAHIENSLKFLNLEDFDVVKYRNKNLSNWRKYLELLTSNANMEKEAEKIVLASVIRDFHFVMPISIGELDKLFYLSNDLLKALVRYFYEDSNSNTSADDVIEMLREKFANQLK